MLTPSEYIPHTPVKFNTNETPLSYAASCFLKNFAQIVERPTYVLNKQSTPQEALVDNDKSWRIHIAIKPNSDNLNLAASTIARVFNTKTINYQLIKLPESEELIGWDLAQADQKQLQRSGHGMGEELVIFMSQNQNTEKFQFTPEIYKELILDCLDALVKNKVEFGYTCAPAFDQYVPCDDFLAQVISFRPPIPSQRRNPWLERNNSLLEHTPLKNVTITEHDLLSRNIDLQHIDQTRAAYLEQHIKDAQSVLDDWFSPKSEPMNHPGHSQLKVLKNNVPHLKNNKHNQDVRGLVSKHMPLDPSNYYEPLIDDNTLKDQTAALNPNLDQLASFIDAEPQAIRKDFTSNPFAMRYIEQQFTAKKDVLKDKEIRSARVYLDALISENLNDMQLLFVRLSQIQHEKNELNQLTIRQKKQKIKAHLNQLRDDGQTDQELENALKVLYQRMATIPAKKRDFDLEAALFTELEIGIDNRNKAGAPDNKNKLRAIIDKMARKGNYQLAVVGAVLIVCGIIFCLSSGLAAAHAFQITNMVTAYGAANAHIGIGLGVLSTLVGSGTLGWSIESRLHKDARIASERALGCTF